MVSWNHNIYATIMHYDKLQVFLNPDLDEPLYRKEVIL